jgi:succinyl-diaminopimelate desuccinylase
VARFAALGIPAVNFGPGDSLVAHARHEHVRLADVSDCEARMRAWLAG